MEALIIFSIFLIAMFIQTGAGFGSALIAMPLLISLLGYDIAAPLFALSFSTVSIVVTYRYRHELRIKNIWRLMVASVFAIPIGVGIISRWDETITLFVFGMFIIVYALYSLLGFKAIRLQHTGWQWGLGALAGMISGAYNTSGPVYVVYGDSQRWQPFEFKGNLQLLFFINSLLTTMNHVLFGNMNEQVLNLWLYAIPGIVAGVGLGFLLDRFIRPEPFRKVVLVILLLVGINMVL